MARVSVGVGNSGLFHKMFIIAMHRGDGEAALDGIVNQWMLSRAMEIDAKLETGGSIRRMLQGKLISPRRYGYGEPDAGTNASRTTEARIGG